MADANSKKRRKRITAAVAMVLILALLGGTFAWNNYRQHKTNDANTGGLNYKAVTIRNTATFLPVSSSRNSWNSTR